MTRSNARHELLSKWLAIHRGGMLRAARSYAGGAIGAEDIVQMAAIVAWRRIEALRNEASVGGWLLRITENEGRNVAERRARRKQLRAGHFGPQPKPPDPFAHTPGFDDNPLWAEVLAAAMSLPPAQQDVVHCWLEGMSCEEMSAELHKTVQAIHALRHRALRSLKAILTPPHAEP